MTWHGHGIIVDMDDDHIHLARRALEHRRTRTTDSADGVIEVPVSDYTDPAVWELETRRIFQSKPFAVALTAELPDPNDYKALDVCGTPLLLTRGADGLVRAFLNVCRHRGARLCEPGTGKAQRFACPYHGWTYNATGKLVGVYRADQFGSFDRGSRGLVELPTVERHGLVWLTLSPDQSIDVDEWLGDYGPELESLKLEGWHLHDQHVLDGANWKIVMDGYLEGYHGGWLHADSLGPGTADNLTLVDTYGPHQRLTFVRESVDELGDLPVERWEPTAHLVPNHIIFPNVSISGGWHDIGSVCIVLPGAEPGSSLTYQSTITRRTPRARADVAVARNFSGLMMRVARDEDYPTVSVLQECIASGANETFLLGENEMGVQHFQRWVRRLTDRERLPDPASGNQEMS